MVEGFSSLGKDFFVVVEDPKKRERQVRRIFTAEKMLLQKNFWGVIVVLVVIIGGSLQTVVEGRPHRILLDTDVDTDDFFALLYLLKLNRSEFQLEVSS